jgi:hypothetical protein
MIGADEGVWACVVGIFGLRITGANAVRIIIVAAKKLLFIVYTTMPKNMTCVIFKRLIA